MDPRFTPLVQAGLPSAAIEVLERFTLRGDPDELSRVNPLAFAARFGLGASSSSSIRCTTWSRSST